MDPQVAPIQPDLASLTIQGSQMQAVSLDKPDLFDVIIIGGGPAGIAAAVYCARKKLKTLMLTDSFGGQSIISDDIRNWIGNVSLSGLELANKLEAHVKAYPGEITIKTSEKAIDVKSIKCQEQERICDFEVKTDKGTIYASKVIIIASGARRRKMGIPGEDKFEGKGVAYCSTCDAPIFVGKTVAVIGGGNAGLEAAEDLFKYASEVYIFESGDGLKADVLTQEEVKKNAKLKGIMLNVQALEVIGDKFVTGIKYKNRVTNEEKILEVGGIFVEIGSIPNSEMVKNLVQLDEHGQVMVNFQHARTSHPGVFAAGDVTNDPYKQNNISVGDGVRAALSAYAYLQNRQKQSPASEKL